MPTTNGPHLFSFAVRELKLPLVPIMLAFNLLEDSDLGSESKATPEVSKRTRRCTYPVRPAVTGFKTRYIYWQQNSETELGLSI
jgi:hypothetical protein